MFYCLAANSNVKSLQQLVKLPDVASEQYTVLTWLLQLYNSFKSFVYPPCPQRCDRGRHSAAARPSDGPVRHAGAAAHLPPQHHPLHRGHLNPAVHDRNHRSSYSGPGCIPQQVTRTTVNLRNTKLNILLHVISSFLLRLCFRSVWKHFRGLSMCLLLLVFPVFMAYKISQFFHMDFWLLILVSSCMLTSLQVGRTTLYVYEARLKRRYIQPQLYSVFKLIYSFL